MLAVSVLVPAAAHLSRARVLLAKCLVEPYKIFVEAVSTRAGKCASRARAEYSSSGGFHARGEMRSGAACATIRMQRFPRARGNALSHSRHWWKSKRFPPAPAKQGFRGNTLETPSAKSAVSLLQRLLQRLGKCGVSCAGLLRPCCPKYLGESLALHFDFHHWRE